MQTMGFLGSYLADSGFYRMMVNEMLEVGSLSMLTKRGLKDVTRVARAARHTEELF
jgi:hypothetical protein